jgi:spore germination protein YaaH
MFFIVQPGNGSFMKPFFSALLFLPLLLHSQDQPASSHQRQWEYYRDHPEEAGKEIAPPLMAKRSDLMQAQTLNKVVYGFHPYWQNGSESNYYFSLLTHLAYFSGDVDAATGNFTTTNSWSSANVVTLAKSYGVKVHFSVVLFSNHSTLLGSTTAKNNLINNIMTQINLRGADGCNIDFESISGTQATAYRDFLKQLGDTLKAHDKEFVVELFAVDWNNVFPSSFFSTLNSVVDYYFIMLYDYYYSGSTTAGPVAPLMSTTNTSYRHVLRSIKAYTDVGAPANKLIAGFPNYGQDWPVASNARMASTTGTGSSRTYSVVKNNYIDTIAGSNQFVDATFSTPWYRYISGGVWRQTWYDDSLSWAKKFDSIKVKNVAGTGMWALGYDGSEPELWGALKTAFAQTTPVSHTLLDGFESGLGHFSTAPTFSGTTAGISKFSTAALTNDAANVGAQSVQITLKDSSVSTNWTVRMLSGSGTVANNTAFNTTGYFGLWLKTTSSKSGLQVALSVDDGPGGTLISSKQTITADGAWHLYEWNLTSTVWTILAGSDAVLNGPTATLDAVMIYANNDAADLTLYLDDVSHNSSGTLPVELTDFSGFNRKLQVHLQWSTGTEIDNYGFEVERNESNHRFIGTLNQSTDGSMDQWQRRGFVPGNGTVSTPNSYQFVDGVEQSGTYTYRLRQIDRTGAFRYSGEMRVTITGYPEAYDLAQNFPNPFNPVTTLQFTIPDGSAAQPVSLTVYDMLGRRVAELVNGTREPGLHSVQWNASGNASGIYFAKLTAGSATFIRKLTLLK